MRRPSKSRTTAERGFSLTEVLIALLITTLVMAAVYGLLQKGQEGFRREPQVADMNQSARAGLDRVSRDLTMAGLQTPPTIAVLWNDGGGITPDELTIIYGDPLVPTAEAKCDGGGGGSDDTGNTGGGGGGGDPGDGGGKKGGSGKKGGGFAQWLPPAPPNWALLGRGAGFVDPGTSPGPGAQRAAWSPFDNASAHAAFFGKKWKKRKRKKRKRKKKDKGKKGGGSGKKGGGDNNGGGNGGSGGGACNTIYNSSVLNLDPDTLDPAVADPTQAYQDGMMLFAIETSDCNADGQIGIVPFEVTGDPQMTNAGGSPTLQIRHNPGQSTMDLNLPGGFNGEVLPDCAVVGFFRVIQYRVNPLPPVPNPALERRDLSAGEPWTPLANNIENLQVQYAVGTSNNFVDEPATPDPDVPATWVTRVRVAVAGRSESTNLKGATQGVFAAEDTHLRKTFSTTVSLRNQVYAAGESSNTSYN